MHTPYKTTRLPDTKHYTYLDVQGRPVVTIKNVGELTEKHIQDFQLEFVLPRYVEGSAKRWSPGCMIAAGIARQKW